MGSEQNTPRRENTTPNMIEEYAPHPYHSLNEDGEIITVNEAWVETLGYDRGDVEGKWFGDFLPHVSEEEFNATLDKFKADGHILSKEYRIECSDGEVLVVSFDGVVEYDENNDFVQAHCQFTNITERKRYETFIENSPDIILVNDESGNAKYVSPGIARELGYDPESLLGKNPFDDVHPDDRERVTKTFNSVLSEPEEVITEEYRVKRADGSYIWVESRARNLLDQEDVNGILLNLRVIEKRKEHEQELERANTLFNQAGEIADIGAWETDIRNNTGWWTEQVNHIYGLPSGYEPDPGEGIEYFHPDDQPVIREAFERAEENGEPYDLELRVVTDDGTQKWVRTQAKPKIVDGEVVRVRGTIQDITERKQKQERVEFLESLATQTTELSHELLRIGETSIDEKVNEALETIGLLVESDRSYVFEVDLEEETLTNTHEWTADSVKPQIENLQNIPFNDLSWVMERLKKYETLTIQDVSDLPPEASSVQETLQDQNIESLIVSPMVSEGELVGFIGFDWVEKQQTWPEDLVHLLQTSGEIISSAIQRESRRRELERREAYLEQSTDIISVMDSNGEVEYQSTSTENVTGFSPAEVIGASGLEHVHPDDREGIGEEFVSFMSQPDAEIQEELRVQTKDGGWEWIEVRGVNKLNDPVIDGLLFSSRDITERKEREQELRKQNKRLDEFASFVSHDLRNPLTVAQGRIDLAREECDSEHLDNAGDAVDRSLELIDDMLELARAGDQVSDMRTVSVDELVRSCWGNVETTNATLQADFDVGIQADQSRLCQLFENLFRNAVEHGGEDVTVTVGTLDDGLYIEDDGPGIPESDRDEVFDAGYSTNDDGTGFGLSIVKQIVEAHEWGIRVTESDSGGARFEITGVTFTGETNE